MGKIEKPPLEAEVSPQHLVATLGFLQGKYLSCSPKLWDEGKAKQKGEELELVTTYQESDGLSQAGEEGDEKCQKIFSVCCSSIPTICVQ